MADKILLVDDDLEFRQELKDALDEYEVIDVPNGQSALQLLRRAHEIGVVILDFMMPGISGTEVLEEIRKTDPGMGVIMLTGYSSKDVAIEALKNHADDYIEKPVDINVLKETIDKLLASRRGVPQAGALDLKGKIEKVKSFIERNCYKKTTLKEAAQAVCLSPKYLSRVFNEHTGVGFSDYKLGLKIEKSKELLEKSGYNVNQISDKLGYENAESFIRQFKKLTGNTPSEYRKRTVKSNSSKNRHSGKKKKLL